ncbi:MAG: hypothetical protein D6753_06605, partial [Planctomycetota bacterium]
MEDKESNQEVSEPVSQETYRRQSAISVTQATVTVVALIVLGTVFVVASEIVLTLFLGVVFAVFLKRLALLIDSAIPLPAGWSIAVVVGALLLLAAGASTLFYVQIDQQLTAANAQIDAGVARLQDLAQRSPTVRSVVSSIPFLSETIQAHDGNT